LTDSTSANFTPTGVKEFIEQTPTLSGLTIYVDERFIAFPQNVLAEIRTMMDKRGGTGFTVVEEGICRRNSANWVEPEPDVEEVDMDGDYVPR